MKLLQERKRHYRMEISSSKKSEKMRCSEKKDIIDHELLKLNGKESYLSTDIKSPGFDCVIASRWEFDLNNTDTNYIEVPLNDNERAEKVVVKQMVWGGANRITSIRITAVNAGPDDLVNIRELEIYGTVQTEPEVELSTETLEYVLNLANEESTDGVIPSVMIKIK